MQVSYSPAGENEDKNNAHHFQLYPSERNLDVALVAVVREYGWRQLSILTQNEQPFIQVSMLIAEAYSYYTTGNVWLLLYKNYNGLMFWQWPFTVICNTYTNNLLCAEGATS